MNRRGFTIVELVTLLVIVGTLVALLVVGGQRTRRSAQLNASLSNLKELSTLTASYHADNADRYWSFSWRRGVVPDSQFADLRNYAQSGDDLAAASAQAIDILRRRTGNAGIPIISSWIPHIFLNPIVLADYAARPLPMWTLVSPADSYLVNRARNPFAGGIDDPYWRFAFSSSYELGTAFYSPDRGDGPGRNTLVQAGTQNSWQFSGPGQNNVLGGRSLADVAFPSQKAFMYDRAQRHFGVSSIYFAFTQARPLVLAVDGHATPRNTAKCLPGFRPGIPRSTFPTSYSYSPDSDRGDPPTPGGGSSATLQGYLRWTRGGLQGRDFDGQEIDTSAW